MSDEIVVRSFGFELIIELSYKFLFVKDNKGFIFNIDESLCEMFSDIIGVVLIF